MNKDIEQAIDNFRRLAGKYSRPERYYKGDHDLSFATEKFQNAFGSLFREFAMNLCPAIVDAVKDKMRITGFRVDGVSSPRVNKGNSGGNRAERGLDVTDANVALTHVRATDTEARRIWRANRMAQRAGEIHKEALRCGDAYAVVWFDGRGDVTIYPQRAASVTVAYDEDTPGRIAWAAKHWRTADKHIRLNLFYPDRTERYVSPKQGSPRSNVQGPVSGVNPDFSTVDFGPWTLDGDSVVPNPYGVVPVFHFANNADIGALGQSELECAIPIQDALNKSILDMLVAMEFSAFRQRWIAGLEVETDAVSGQQLAPFQAGAERLWIAANSDTKFGDFNTSNLDQFLRVKDGFRIDMASVTGTPLHYFLQNTRGFASGESLRKNEGRFLAKVRDRQTAFGQVWADLMSFALKLAGHAANGAELITAWENPAPLDEKEILANLILKKQLGISTEQALAEIGYGSEEVDGRVPTA